MPANRLIEARDASMGEAVSNLLRDCFFAESLEGFVNFWKRNPKFQFLFVATQGGS